MRLLLSIFMIPLVCGFGFFNPRHVHSTTLVQMQGLAEVSWVSSFGTIGDNTAADESNKTKVRVDGISEYLRVWVGATSGTWSFKQIRPTGTNAFDHIFEQDYTPSATGTNLIAAAWTLREGDMLARRLPNATSSIRSTSGGGAGGVDFRITNANITSGSFILPVNVNGNAHNMGIWGKGPALGYVGDSIQTGYPDYFPYLAGQIEGGLASNSVPWKLKHLHVIHAHYANFCVGGETVQYVASTEMTAATNYGTKLLVVQAGVNNLATDAWSDVVDDYLLIRSKHRGPLIFVSILPTSVVTDANSLKRRQWNTNLVLLAASNGSYFLDLQTEFGTNRVATGMPDDAKPEYVLPDNIHLSALGSDVYGRLLKPAVIRHVK